jgi:hypothetical protein
LQAVADPRWGSVSVSHTLVEEPHSDKALFWPFSYKAALHLPSDEAVSGLS